MNPDVLCSAVLQLWLNAQSLGTENFLRSSTLQLAQLVGFEGSVWGSGLVAHDGLTLTIAEAAVIDRPLQILADYAPMASQDPTTANFLSRPERVQSVNVQSDYGQPEQARLREFLDAYQVGHLLINGVRLSGGTGVSWFTAYRQATDQPFTAAEAALFQQLLPLWMHARHVNQHFTRVIASPQVKSQPVSPLALPVNASSMVRAALSRRELQVLALIAQGYSYKQIADLTCLSVDTVSTHIRHIYAKLGVSSKTQAVFEARLHGLLK